MEREEHATVEIDLPTHDPFRAGANPLLEEIRLEHRRAAYLRRSLSQPTLQLKRTPSQKAIRDQLLEPRPPPPPPSPAPSVWDRLSRAVAKIKSPTGSPKSSPRSEK
jgi:hypothetical protein